MQWRLGRGLWRERLYAKRKPGGGGAALGGAREIEREQIVHVRCFLGIFPHILVAVGRACLQGRVCVNKRKGKRSEALYYRSFRSHLTSLSSLVTRLWRGHKTTLASRRVSPPVSGAWPHTVSRNC